ncbi:Opioid growth factor receptor-like protein 1 [Acipenser ruthenus]|uniref:Opioid growth factor receptor-like protein 1 n=1 Tax=Acipenser ruthenus TaxID=7906 RepID=A0A444U5H7_ACIRT|nr:Opioid growth factor receptor-like protein 1 [Acipenser ruthenus]
MGTHDTNPEMAKKEFQEAAHGKGPHDGVGGTIKFTADRNVAESEDIEDAEQLYLKVQQHTNITMHLITTDDISKIEEQVPKYPLTPVKGIYIEEILTKWKGDYEKLEHNHTYIQWLFPLREQGLNFYAQELTQAEIKEFQGTREAKRRFLVAYTVMLDFFGIKLLDKNGTVARAANWQDRFQHLNESQHNYLRITRILKSLGELGFESFKAPLVKLLLEEALVEETMPNMVHSVLEYFVYTIRNRKERRVLLRFAQLHYQPPEHFIWGLPKKRKPGAKINCTQEKNTARSKPTREAVAKNTASLHTSGDSSTGKTENNRSDKTENENQAKTANPASTDGQVFKTEEKSSKNGKPSVANKPKQANTFKKKPEQGGRVEKQNQK